MKFFYSILKLRQTKKIIILVSRESDEESLDFRLLREELEKNGQYEIIVLAKKLKKTILGILEYTLHVIIQMWYFSVAEVVVTDTYCLSISLLTHKKSLRIIQIWHAVSAIKKFGFQTIGLKDGASRDVAEIMRMHKNYDYIISSSKITDKYFSKAFNVSEDKIVRAGLPRIDYLENISRSKSLDIFEVYSELKHDSRKIILYVPTMRRRKSINLQQLVSNFSSQDYIFIIKLHPLDIWTDKICFDNVIYDDKFISYDLLNIADYIVSDYSSFSVEASIVNKPLYFYLYDYEEYIEDNGVNIDFTNEPISDYVAKDSNQLYQLISENYDFTKLKEFRNRYIDENLKNCTKQLSDFILGNKI